MKFFNTRVLVLIIALVFFASCDDDLFTDDDQTFRGSPVIVTESRDLASFHSIVSTPGLELEVTAGQVQSVEVTSNDNLIDRVRTTVSSGVLTIEMEEGSYEFLTLEIHIVIPEVQLVENHGAGAIEVIGFEETERLTIRSTGAANFLVTGSGQELVIDLTGAGDVAAFDFIADDVVINLAGAGNMQVYAVETLTGNLTGAGNITYKGEPTIDVTITGAGSVVDGN